MSAKKTRKPRVSKQKTETPIEDIFAAQLKEEGIAGWERECTFIPGRKFRADFYFPRLRLDIEIDGGVYLPYGGHTTGDGYTKDRERDNLALLYDIQPVRYTTQMVRDRSALAHLKELIPLRTAYVEGGGA